MGKIALVFPGQGSQYAGMGYDLFQKYPSVKKVFQATDERLGFALSKIIFEGPDDQLTLTANAQPAILTTSLAVWAMLEAEGIVPDVVAGHSLGEYTAIVVAGGLSREDAAFAVHRRGELMQKAVPVGVGSMAALLGLSKDSVEQICDEASNDEVLSMANINSPGQIVIAGHTAAVDRAVELAAEFGAKRAIKLQVSAPFHCSLMKPAREAMVDVLDQVEFSDLRIPLITNAGVEKLTDKKAVKSSLLEQITAPVRWQETIERMVAEGVDLIIEVGPGKVLSGLAKRTNRMINVLNAENEESLKETLEAIKGM